MGQFADDIRRIVGKTDELNNKPVVGEGQPKIPAKKSTVYGPDAGSSGSKKGTGSGSVDTGTKNGEDPKDANPKPAGDPTASDPAAPSPNGGTTGSDGNIVVNTPESGVFDVASILDQYADNALSELGGQVLAGITGFTDCDNPTLQGEVRMDNFYIPPITWYNADEYYPTTEDPSWTDGFFWTTSLFASSPMFATADDLGMWMTEQYNALGSGYTYAFDHSDVPGSGVYAGFDAGIFAIATLISTGVADTSASPIGTGTKTSCGATTTGACSIHTNPGRTTLQWPPDNKFQLTSIAGQFNTSNKEPAQDTPAKYTAPTSSVYMCFGAGRTAVLQAGVNGTQLLYETNADGTPKSGGVIHQYDSTGKTLGYSDTTILNRLLPK